MFIHLADHIGYPMCATFASEYHNSVYVCLKVTMKFDAIFWYLL